MYYQHRHHHLLSDSLAWALAASGTFLGRRLIGQQSRGFSGCQLSWSLYNAEQRNRIDF